MAWITIPHVFRGKGGQRVPVSQVDDDFQYLADQLNAFNPTGSPAGPGGIYGVRNLNGSNNAGAPTTAYDFSADAILLRNPTDGSFIVRSPTGALSNDTTVPGPTPNGSDQATAFANDSWIHLYAIWNPTSSVLATLSSLQSPPNGPSLPAGSTMWAYIGAIRKDSGGLLVLTFIRGTTAFYRFAPQVVTSASPAINTEDPVDLTAIIPPNALRVLVNAGAAYFNGATSGTTLSFRVVSGEPIGPLRGTVFAGSGAPITAQIALPNFNQQYLYLWNVDTPSAPTFVSDQWVSAYSMPNGGE